VAPPAARVCGGGGEGRICEIVATKNTACRCPATLGTGRGRGIESMNSGGTGHTTTTAGAEAGKVRLYEVAKDLGLANKDLVAKVRALGIEVKNHMSNLDPDDVARVKRALDKERQANLVEERLSSTVIRRRSKDGGVITRAAAPAAASPSARPTPPPSRDAEEERSIFARAAEAVTDVVHKVQEVAHEVVEKV